MSKPKASFSLDLDNKWSYMKNNGAEDWEEYPSYLDIFIPYILEVLEELDLKLTFFIVGQDAAFENNHKYIRMIVDGGHEIANHSFKHETFLHLYTKEELEDEIDKAHSAIRAASGREPRGFRGPGFTWSETLFEVLVERGYLYDSSTFPTIIGPLARMYYFRTSKLTAAQKKERKELFGKFSDGFMKLKPYFWKLKNNRKLLELPVTTMPLFRIPIHLTYLVYLSAISSQLMFFYLKCAVYLCKLTNTSPNFLIHPTDLLGEDMVTGMEFFPGMKISSHRKLEIFKKVINIFARHFTLVTMEEFAAGIFEKYDKEVIIDQKIRH
ncbi:MAG: polysaccharide deacetylase family protein [Maribacter sp.]|uniref:polysaccharide deacetylase family protein n=1 Tax=Maribacter sp. TaxID=1897614 RepID=UPI003C73D831